MIKGNAIFTCPYCDNGTSTVIVEGTDVDERLHTRDDEVLRFTIAYSEDRIPHIILVVPEQASEIAIFSTSSSGFYPGVTSAIRKAVTQPDLSERPPLWCPTCDGDMSGVVYGSAPKPDHGEAEDVDEEWLDAENNHGQGSLSAPSETVGDIDDDDLAKLLQEEDEL